LTKFENHKPPGSRPRVDWGTREKTAVITAGAEEKRLIAATAKVTKELLKLVALEFVILAPM